jgi:hypothetical protein
MKKLRAIHLSDGEITLLIKAVQTYEDSNENEEGVEFCERVLKHLASLTR